MSLDAVVTGLVTLAVVALLVRDAAPPAAIFLGAVVLLLVVGVIEPAEAFAGFSNPAPITVGALYVVARAVEATGALEPLTGRLLRDGLSPRAVLARVTVPTMAASAFLNNTPIVAMLAPPMRDWAERHGQAASRFLIPVSYAAILGGVVTAIGTSTNLIVSGLLVADGRPALGLFELARVGLPVAAIGGLVIVALAGRLLPDRSGAGAADMEEEVREFTVGMRVVRGGPAEGCTLAEAGLRALDGVYCVELVRAGSVVAPVPPTQRLAGGDELAFVGRVDRVVDLQRIRGLESTEARQLDRVAGSEQRLFEAVLGAASPLVGQTIRGVGFRGRYQAAVLAVHRSGERVDAKIGDVRLRVGDTLLLLADQGFRGRWRESGHFLLIAPLGAAPHLASRKAPLVAIVVAALVVVTATGLVPILNAALVAAVVVVLVGALSTREARGAVDLDVLVVIAAAFGLGAALDASGLAGGLARGLVALGAPFGAYGALAGVLLATVVLTELITNNAAAVLAFPIATATAAAVGADPRPFAIAVAVGASLSFITPIGYQTNLMVYALGGYRFSDFARLGLPLSLVCTVLALVLIPLGWPF